MGRIADLVACWRMRVTSLVWTGPYVLIAGEFTPCFQWEFLHVHGLSQPASSGNCSLLSTRPNRRPLPRSITFFTFHTSTPINKLRLLDGLYKIPEQFYDATSLSCHVGYPAFATTMCHINGSCMNGKSGDCEPVRENGSVYCNSGCPFAWPRECLHLHAADNLCMERMQSITDVLSSFAGNKNPAASFITLHGETTWLRWNCCRSPHMSPLIRPRIESRDRHTIR